MFIFTNEGGRKNLNHLREAVDYWHRPGGAIHEVADQITEDNKKDYNSLENKYKEIFIGSLFLIVLEKVQNQKFYISKTKNDPPDFVFMFPRKDEKDRLWLTSREVEIVRNVNSIEELEKTILSKDNNYPKDITVLCYVETPGQADLRDLSTNICSKLKNVSDVFLLFNGGMMDNMEGDLSKKISLIQLSPEYISYSCEIDIDDVLKNFMIDEEKLMYTKDGKVYYGKRNKEDEYPKLIK